MSLRARLRPLEPVLRHVRPLYRWMRTQYLRRRYPEGAYLVANDTRVYCDFAVPAYVWYDVSSPFAAFERSVLLDLQRRSEGNVFIDVGAHFGFFSKVMSDGLRGRERAKIIAVEPDRVAFRCLSRTVADAPAGEVILLNIAVSDSDGELTLYGNGAWPCLHSYAEPTTAPVDRIPAARLDTIVASHLTAADKVAVIKIDIDGAEWSFLDGATDTLQRDRPFLFVEFSPVNLRAAGVEPRALVERLDHYGALEWIRLSDQTRSAVTAADAEAIVADTGEAVANLVVIPR